MGFKVGDRVQFIDSTANNSLTIGVVKSVGGSSIGGKMVGCTIYTVEDARGNTFICTKLTPYCNGLTELKRVYDEEKEN